MAEVFVVVLVLLSIVVENVSANVVRVVLVTAVGVVVGTSVVVLAVVATVAAAVFVLVALAVVTGGAIASCSSCGRHRKPLHTAPHNTNTAAAADSHRRGKYLGVGTTCF